MLPHLQIEVGESEAATLRRQNTELKNKNALLEKEKAAAERAAKDKTALFEKQAKEREAELKKLKTDAKEVVEAYDKNLAHFFHTTQMRAQAHFYELETQIIHLGMALEQQLESDEEHERSLTGELESLKVTQTKQMRVKYLKYITT